MYPTGAASVMAPAVANPAYMGYKVLYKTVLDKVWRLFVFVQMPSDMRLRPPSWVSPQAIARCIA